MLNSDTTSLVIQKSCLYNPLSTIFQIRRTSKFFQEEVDFQLTNLWNEIKKLPDTRPLPIKEIAEKAEQMTPTDSKASRCFSMFLKLLFENSATLECLEYNFGLKQQLSISNLLDIQQNVIDHSLITLWEVLRNTLQLDDSTEMFSPNDIRSWMNDPSNQARLETIKELNLSNKRLKYIPEEIRFMPNIKTLDLSFNRIQWIPKEVDELSQLEVFNFEENSRLNDLRELPKDFSFRNTVTIMM